MATRVLVTGAGGFIGHHIVDHLKGRGFWVRGVDLKVPEFAATRADEFRILDLRNEENCTAAALEVDQIYHLAADTGGMGFISQNHSRIYLNNMLIDLGMIEAARRNGVKRIFYASSACAYPEYLQVQPKATPLKEEQAYPAQPQDAYGWEKLMAERLCADYSREHGIEVRIARFHNIFGPLGTWTGGREKAPAAFCRKVAAAKLAGESEVEVWGDGEQTRSFCYVDDCVKGICLLMDSGHSEPLNLGQDRLISINELVDMVSEAAGIAVRRKHVPGPEGVRGRNSDNSLLQRILGWSPEIPLEEGIRRTYQWVEQQVQSSTRRLTVGDEDETACP